MFRIAAPLAMTVLLLAHECNAQFLDTFDGTSLAPHWEIFSTPEHLTHHVSGGLLTVTNLPLPSHPKMPSNTATMLASFTPVSGDFAARAVVGWDEGTERLLIWSLSSPAGSLLAQMTYGDSISGGPGVRVGSGAGPVGVFPAPESGMHEFALTREGSMYSAFLNGTFLLSFSGPLSDPVSRVSLRFVVAYPSDGFEPMYADFIEVVPAPASVAPLTVLSIVCIRRRRA